MVHAGLSGRRQSVLKGGKGVEGMEHINSGRQQMEQEIDRAEQAYCANKPKVLTIIWLSIQVLVICLIASSLAAKADATYHFLAILSSLFALMLSCMGTIVLRRYRTPYHHGLLVGFTFMTGILMLSTGISASTYQPYDAAEGAVATFSLFLFVFYIIFAVLLIKWRDDIIGKLDDDEMVEEVEANGVSESGQANGEGKEPESDLKMV